MMTRTKQTKYLSAMTVSAVLTMVAGPALAQTFYVSNSSTDTVSVIRPNDGGVIATIPVGDNPQSVAVSPDGLRVYTANANDNTISVIDAASLQTIATYFTAARPYNIVVSPDGTRLYVANYTAQSVSVLNAQTGDITFTFNIDSNPIGLTLSRDGDKLFIGSYDSGLVYVQNTVNPTDLYPSLGLASYVYPGAATGNNDQVLLPSSVGLHLYDTSTLTAQLVTGGSTLHGAAYNAQSDYFAAADYNGEKLLVGHLATPQDRFEIALNGKPNFVAFNQDGSEVWAPYFGTYGDTTPMKVGRFQTSTGVLLGEYTVGGNPSGIAFHNSSPATIPVPTPIPTLTEWAMILLGVVLAGFAALTLQRRRQNA